MEYMIKVQTGDIPFPSYKRSSRFPTAHAKQKLSEVLLQHSFDSTKELMPQASYRKDKRIPLALRAEVCPDCLSHKLICVFRPTDMAGEIQHSCDASLLLDTPQLETQKQAAISVLEKNIPVYLAKFVREYAGKPPTLSAQEIWGPRTSHPNELIIERLMSFPTDAFTEALVRQLKVLESDTRRFTKSMDHIKILSEEEYDWIRRVCRDSMTVLNDSELQQYFTLTNLTSVTADIGHK
jgi:hypothetical protein